MTSINMLAASHSKHCNDLIQLREWGSEVTYPLPMFARRCTIGSDVQCPVRLSGSDVLPWHAQLVRQGRQWLVRSLDGVDGRGLLRDGARCDAFALEPGVELQIAGRTLVAESPAWIALRQFCARLLGWEVERLPAIDRALRALRSSMSHRAPLVLYGAEDLVPIAHALHCRTLGPARAFIVCDPRRRPSAASARAAANWNTGQAALRAAIDGSLAVRIRRRPPDMAEVRALLACPDAGVQLILCGTRPELGEPAMQVVPIEIPALTDRSADLPRLVDEYGHDACVTFGVPPEAFTSEDRAWVLVHAARSFAAIEKATLRRVALRTSANLTRAAARLGMAPVSLASWKERRVHRTEEVS